MANGERLSGAAERHACAVSAGPVAGGPGPSLPAMPVLVTAADRPLGARLVLRLLEGGGEVRAYGRPGRIPGEVRRSQAFVATGEPDHGGLIEAALAGVHTVVHPAGGLLSPSVDAVAEPLEAVAGAAERAGVRRVVALSPPGSTVQAGDRLRRVKAEGERLLRGADLPTVVVRPSLVDTSALRDALAGLDPTAEVLERPVAPVRPDDLVALVALIDAARSSVRRGHVVFAADGAERMSLADYLRRAGVGLPGTPGRREGRRYRPADAAPLLEPALAGPWVNEDERLLDAWKFAGLTPEPVPRG